MGRKSHNELRRQGHKLPTLKTVSLRVSPELWQRAGWAAAARKVDRSEFVRDTLEDATKDAKPLVPPQFRGVSGSPSQMELWEKAAAHLQVPIDEFASQALDYAAKRLLRPKPAADDAHTSS